MKKPKLIEMAEEGGFYLMFSCGQKGATRYDSVGMHPFFQVKILRNFARKSIGAKACKGKKDSTCYVNRSAI